MTISERHPWMDGRFPYVSSLSATHRVWTFLAAHTAAGDQEGVAEDWRFLEPEDQGGALEIILQTHLFAGYPRTINALATVHEMGISPGVLQAQEPGQVSISHGEAGEGLCRRVYGDMYPRLRRRMASLHADLDRWMIEMGYGRVLSRAGATARERELCVLAVLAGQDVSKQLESHIRGALHVGATEDECYAVLQQTEIIWGAAHQTYVDDVWAGLGVGAARLSQERLVR